MTTEPERNDVTNHDEIVVNESVDVKVLIKGFDTVFLAEAQRAAKQATEALAVRDGPAVAGATAVAVLLGTAACEARVSEYLASHEGELGSHFVEQVRGHDDALQQWRTILAKASPAFPIGSSLEYLALGCLFKLRNLVSHRGARFLPLGTWPNEVADCVRQHAIPVHKGDDIDWTSGVYVRQVAEWAAKTATDWLAIAHGLGIN